MRNTNEENRSRKTMLGKDDAGRATKGRTRHPGKQRQIYKKGRIKMASVTRSIARRKTRSMNKTRAAGNPKRVGKAPFMGASIYFRENQDSPRTNPVEYKRVYTKEQAQKMVQAEIKKYKERREARKNRARKTPGWLQRELAFMKAVMKRHRQKKQAKASRRTNRRK
jgi:hypothetical protein